MIDNGWLNVLSEMSGDLTVEQWAVRIGCSRRELLDLEGVTYAPTVERCTVAIRERIYRMLQPAPATLAEIARDAEVSQRVARQAIQQLSDAGRIGAFGQGHWRSVEAACAS